MRIGFLFNHDQIHQVGHSLPIALALAKLAPDVEVVVATTNERLRAEVIRLTETLNQQLPSLVELRPKRLLSRIAVSVLDRLLPAAKLLVYRDNLEFFRSLDALVVAEKTSIVLKTRYRLSDLRLIHTRHGAGDRAIGFDKSSNGFDQILVSGPKVRQRLIAEANVNPERLATVGYPKFDLIPPVRKSLPLQSNGRPTVLYNPHVSPHLSSWYRDGRAVLDFFIEHPEYNLIFAPHVMLFERPMVVSIDKLRIDQAGTLDAKYFRAENILIDLGSSASTDMTYTLAADLYLGDVSSQVYEFMHTPRPCVFLNSHNVDYQNNPNYLHWAAGEVIASPAELEKALQRAFAHPDAHRSAQRRIFDETFEITAVPSAKRAAAAIISFLSGSAQLPAKQPSSPPEGSAGAGMNKAGARDGRRRVP